MNINRKDRGLALITGATEGIGYELAKCCAADGYDLIMVARTFDRLERVAEQFEEKFGIAVHTCTQDLSIQDSAKKVVNFTRERELYPNMLINNAGFGNYGPFIQRDPERVSSLIRLNIEALTMLTRYFAGDMEKMGGGRIMNVASTAAFQPGPMMAEYFASKAYVRSFSEALANELDGTGVTVTTLCPGPTTTNFWDRAEKGRTLLDKLGRMDPKTIALRGYEGMMKGKLLVVPGLVNRLLTIIPGLIPDRFSAYVVGRLLE